jgi:hypothetical protein
VSTMFSEIPSVNFMNLSLAVLVLTQADIETGEINPLKLSIFVFLMFLAINSGCFPKHH